MEKVKEFVKKNKVAVIICAVLVLVLLGVASYFIFFNSDESKKESGDGVKETEKADDIEETNEDELLAPAEDTEELVESLDAVEVLNITEDKIEFAADVQLEEGEKVEVWIYSKPKFLGYFEVVVKNGVKQIKGLQEALKNIEIDDGEHNIAIVTEDGKPVGYIDVYIEKSALTTNQENKADDKTETEVKKEVKEEEISFDTKTVDEVNMKRGTKEVSQKGVNGTKEVTYEVTYDADGKEISRKKISEKTTKEPVDQIEKVGVSDYNLNEDHMLTEISFGPYCTESELTTDSDGYKMCDSENDYYAAKVDNQYYITALKINGTNVITKAIKASEGEVPAFLTATYKGTKYYFYMSAGGGMYDELTQEICDDYNLACGTW